MCWRYRITSPLLSVTVNTVQMVAEESKFILQLWRLQLYFVQTEDFLKLLFLMNVFHLLGIWLTTKASCVINVFAIKYMEYESCAFALLCSASLTPSPSPCWKINIITEDERLHASVTVAAILSKEL